MVIRAGAFRQASIRYYTASLEGATQDPSQRLPVFSRSSNGPMVKSIKSFPGDILLNGLDYQESPEILHESYEISQDFL